MFVHVVGKRSLHAIQIAHIEGKFGNNVIAQATLMRYEDRLPHRKIQDALKRMHGLLLSPATIFDLTRRAGEAVRPEYDALSAVEIQDNCEKDMLVLQLDISDIRSPCLDQSRDFLAF